VFEDPAERLVRVRKNTDEYLQKLLD
jgi:hypothetical protein